MRWRDFQHNYLIEVDTFSSVDIQFDENTPMFAVGKPSIQKVTKARVLDKHTFETIREYPIELDSDEIRMVENKLRKLITRDFQIVELGTPPKFSELHQGEPEAIQEKPSVQKIG